MCFPPCGWVLRGRELKLWKRTVRPVHCSVWGYQRAKVINRRENPAGAHEQWCNLWKDQLGKYFLYLVIALTVAMACIYKPVNNPGAESEGIWPLRDSESCRRQKRLRIPSWVYTHTGRKTGSVREPDGFGSHITAHTAGYFLKQSEMLLHHISSSRQTESAAF